MKIKNIWPFFCLVGVVLAQDASPPADPDEPSVAAPRAQVIEEDESSDDGEDADEPNKEELSGGVDRSDNESDTADTGTEGKDAPTQQGQDEQNPQDEGLAEDLAEDGAREGIQVQVEKFIGASGELRRGDEVKISSPWPAKPLDSAPLGWKFVPGPSGVTAYQAQVDLGEGQSVNLSITPYVLVPASDGRQVMRIPEPGYDPSLSLEQAETVGAILVDSVDQIERCEKATTQAINRLQQLLSSLPKP